MRVARIAAGAVIAAGASLTVAGVASATGDQGGKSGLVETATANVKSPDDPTDPDPCDITVCTTDGGANGDGGNGADGGNGTDGGSETDGGANTNGGNGTDGGSETD
ncbi:hypothetical protein ACFWO0_38485, partial [Streptomyces sp. NPDC058461]